LQEKIDPYLRPLYDALFDMMDPERVERYLEKNVIEIAPIAFMRGRTLNDSFVILDEAQNTTSEQMKMFVTRLGFGSKAVITGDITQIDLPNARRSGLLEAIDILKDVNGLAFVHFDESDVVRHIWCSALSARTTNSRRGKPDRSCLYWKQSPARRKRRTSPTARIVQARMSRRYRPRHSAMSRACAINQFDSVGGSRHCPSF